MHDYCATNLNAQTGDNYLEFIIGRQDWHEKFQSFKSFFVSDIAFYCFDVGNAIASVVSDFDMFEDTIITKRQWAQIFQIASCYDDTTRQILEDINTWVTTVFDAEEFTILGV
jgi:hypothetical protein